MSSIINITCMLFLIVLINLIQAKFTEVPPPPKRPDHFNSREELKRYLQKVHEYHSIVGRWRLRRDSDEYLSSHSSADGLFNFFDINNDHHISNSEFAQRLKFKNEKQ